MKIYIVQYNPKLFKQSMTTISNLLVGTVERKEIYSEKYGMQITKNNKVYQIESKFETQMEIIKYNDFDILLDYTSYNQIDIISQLPVDYILIKYWYFEYKLNKQSKLKLIVKCIKEEDNNKNEMLMNFAPINFIPTDLYFEYDDKFDLNNSHFQEEFNMLLSHIN
jgi:hypothetical protein